MVTRDRQRDMLATIFSFFLGLMVVSFIGIGVNTALPNPQQDYYNTQSPELEGLYAERDNLQKEASRDGTVTAVEQQRIASLDTRITMAEKGNNAEMQKRDRERQATIEKWARDTSIVLVICATIVMAISLIRAEQLRLISNGLLLGGLFTMLYGTGYAFFSGESWVRFGVVAFALLATVGLGWVKFVRSRQADIALEGAGSLAAGTALDDAAVSALGARVARLEARAAAAAAALGADEPHED